MSAGRSARWPWVAVAAFLTLATAGTVLVVLNHESVVEQVPFIAAFGLFGLVGALILSRAQGNRVGSLLLYGSCATALSFVAGEYVTYAVGEGTTRGVVEWLALLSELGWVLGLLPVLFLLPLLFPDGRPPSPRWRPLVWAVVAVTGLLALAFVVGTETLTGSRETATVANPLYVSSTADAPHLADALVNVLFLAMLVGSFASIVVRFRRSVGAERQQIKWVALAVLLLVVSLVISTVFQANGLLDALITGPAFLALPVSIGVAVLQYRLYELDVVVRKTLIAGAIGVVVVAAYAGAVSVLGAIASERQSASAAFLAALLLGMAFRPVTRRARRIADRLVYGRRATPYEVLTEFSGRVGEAYATDDVLARMAQILGEGVGAARARVWLMVGGELRAESGWPIERELVAARPDPDEAVVEVRDGGELLGALSVAMPANDPMTPAKEKLVRDLASQAGLALRNVRLVEELKASQRRIVAAQDEERRRIERNIHDGAQQQLVALAVKARLARQVLERDSDRAEQMLAEIEGQTQGALEDLRDLARGIYPPLLADRGLPAALEAQARRSPVPVEVSPDGVGRYPQEVEAAVYFCALEALQNVAKYAEATSVRVELGEGEGWLSFSVVDDGRGFDPDATQRGTGLQGMADRLAALGGAVRVTSQPGNGTAVTGRVPVRWSA